MAADLNIDVSIDTANSAKTLGELRKSLKELISLQGQIADRGSAEFKRLSRAINETEGKIGDLNDSFNTLRGSGVERVNASLSLFKQGLLNADTEQLTIGLKGLKAAMNAIPIFLLIEGFTLLVENYDKIVGFFSDTAKGAAAAAEQTAAFTKTLKEQGEINAQYLAGLDNNTNVEAERLKRQGQNQDTINDFILKRNRKTIDELYNLSSESKSLLLELEEDYHKARFKLIKDANDVEAQETVKRYEAAEEAAKQAANKADEAQDKNKLFDAQRITQEQENEEARRRAFENARIDTIVFSRQRELELEAEKYKELVYDAKLNYGLIEQLAVKHKQNLYDINTKYDAIERERREAELLRDENYLKQFNKQREDAAKNQETVANDKFNLSLTRGSYEFSIEHANLAKSLQGRIQLIEEYRDRELTKVSETSEAAAIINENANQAIINENVKHYQELLSYQTIVFSKRIDLIEKLRDEELKAENLTAEQRIEINARADNAIFKLKVQKAQEYLAYLQATTEVIASINQIQTDNETYALNQQEYAKDAAIQNDANRTEEKLQEEEKHTNDLLNNDSLTQTQRENISANSEEKKRKISENSKNNELKLQQDFDKKATDIKRKQFQREKQLQIATGVINTAAAVLQTLASVPYPANIPLSILAGVAGAAQVAVIANQKFDDGGYSANSSVAAVSGINTGSSRTSSGSNAPNSFDPNAIENKYKTLNSKSDLDKVRDQRVYVLESDIRNTTNKVNIYDSRATFGY